MMRVHPNLPEGLFVRAPVF